MSQSLFHLEKPGMIQPSHGARLGLTDLLEMSDLLLHSEKFRFTVSSWSMYPALNKGDQIIVDPVEPEQLQTGDLILYHQDGRLLCHRFVNMVSDTEAGSTFFTKGDAVARVDEPVQAGQILGKVVAVSPGGTWFGGLARCADRGKQKLAHNFMRCIVWLQGMSMYRTMMRGQFSHHFSYSLGLPEGRRWYRYESILPGRSLRTEQRDQRYHLIAKLAGIYVGSVYLEAKGEGYWLESLYVRTRYRGLGVASQLIAYACQIAALGHQRAILARVGEQNTAAQDLFKKLGFCSMPVAMQPGYSVLVLQQHSCS